MPIIAHSIVFSSSGTFPHITITEVLTFIPHAVCWAVPPEAWKPCNCPPRDWRKSSDAETETSVIYWKWDLASPKQRVLLERHPTVHIANSRQDTAAIFITPGEKGYHFQGKLTSCWLTSYQGNRRLGMGKHIGCFWSSPVVKWIG